MAQLKGTLPTRSNLVGRLSIGGGGINNYPDLNNLPQINGVTLIDNKTSEELGINIPTKTSDLENNSGFITSDALPTKTSDLANDSGYTSSTVIADAYDATSTYAVGAYVTHENNLYKCNTAITTAEEWNAEHWTLVDVISAIPTKTSELDNDSNFASIDDNSTANNKAWSASKIGGELSGKADKIVTYTSFVQLAKQYTPGIITTTGYVNTTSASDGYSTSYATPIGSITKFVLPYNFTPNDDSRVAVGFYSGTGLGSYISGLAGNQTAGTVVTVPSGANYYRISCPDSEMFGIDKVLNTTLATEHEFETLNSRLYGKGYYLIKGNLSSGQSFNIPQTNCKNNQVFSFTAKCDDFSNISISIGHGKTVNNSVYINITPTNCDVYRYGATTVTNSHGLTLSQFIDVKIIVAKHNNAKIVIQTADNGGTYEYTLNITNWTGASGDANNNEVFNFAECVSGTLTDCVFSWTCSDFRKQLWAFGDSYFNYDTGRPMYYLDQDGFYDNILVNGYGGENSPIAVVALKNMLDYYGKPKYVFWCMGQNDGSDTTIDNYTKWLSSLNEVLNLCNDYGITPILCTIPSVPKGGGRSHESKNAWIRSSGYRFVDMAEAVGAKYNNGTVTWYPNMLSSDNEHPDIEGGKAIEKRFLLECPELTYSK